MSDKPDNKSATPAAGAQPVAVKRDTGPRLLAREFTVPPAWTLGPPPEALRQGQEQASKEERAGRPGDGVGHGADPKYESRPEDMAASEARETLGDNGGARATGGGLPRDTLRETTNNTLRGLQPGPSEEPPPSRPSPVVVPSLADPTPLTVDPTPDPDTSEQRTSEGEYAAPRPAPRAADHKTLETETVKLDPEVDPRRQITERTLRRPASREPDEPTAQAASSSRRGVLVVAVVLVAAVVVLLLGLRHKSRAQEAPEASGQAAPQQVAPPAPATAQATSLGVAPEPSAPVSAAPRPAPSPPAPTTQQHTTKPPAPVHHKTPAAQAAPKPAPTANKPSTPAGAASGSPWVF